MPSHAECMAGQPQSLITPVTYIVIRFVSSPVSRSLDPRPSRARGGPRGELILLWTVRETLDSNGPWGAKERNDDDEVSENVHPSHQDAFFFLVRMSTEQAEVCRNVKIS
jgi:hypothetical protein